MGKAFSFRIVRGMIAAVAAAVMLAGSMGSMAVFAAGSSAPADIEYPSAKSDDQLADAYEYYLEDGTLKYWLDLSGEELRLHCFFMSGDPVYREEIYTLPLDGASVSNGTLVFDSVKDGRGSDITWQFAFLSVTFVNHKAILSAVRDERTLAGGASGSVMTGLYEMSARSDSAGTGSCVPAILCRMAQAYYARHNEYYPPVADYAENQDGTYTLHLYEVVDDGNGMTHTATSAWYTVDAGGVGTDDLFGVPIDLRK